MLKDIFKRQKSLVKRLHGLEISEMDNDKKEQVLIDIGIGLSEETAETLKELKLQSFKREKRDEKAAFQESIDLLHFLVQLWDHLGHSPEDVHQEFIRKNNLNLERKDHIKNGK